MSRPVRDLTGQRFGQLVVLNLLPQRTKQKTARWLCHCDCGELREVRGSSLTQGHTTSCNSIIHKVSDLSDRRFGHLVVVGLSDRRTPASGPQWLCLCDCGQETIVAAINLKAGNTTSCGCRGSRVNRTKNLLGQKFGRLTVVFAVLERNKHGQVLWSCVCDCGKCLILSTCSLETGHTQSCGCRRLIDYDCYRFRSRWELYWYMAAKVKGLEVEYESRVLPVDIDGKIRKYTPDFWIPSEDRFIEVKGILRPMGLAKVKTARQNGYNIDLVQEPELGVWCGCSRKLLDYYLSRGGPDSVMSKLESTVVA